MKCPTCNRESRTVGALTVYWGARTVPLMRRACKHCAALTALQVTIGNACRWTLHPESGGELSNYEPAGPPVLVLDDGTELDPTPIIPLSDVARLTGFSFQRIADMLDSGTLEAVWRDGLREIGLHSFERWKAEQVPACTGCGRLTPCSLIGKKCCPDCTCHRKVLP